MVLETNRGLGYLGEKNRLGLHARREERAVGYMLGDENEPPFPPPAALGRGAGQATQTARSGSKSSRWPYASV